MRLSNLLQCCTFFPWSLLVRFLLSFIICILFRVFPAPGVALLPFLYSLLPSSFPSVHALLLLSSLSLSCIVTCVCVCKRVFSEKMLSDTEMLSGRLSQIQILLTSHSIQTHHVYSIYTSSFYKRYLLITLANYHSIFKISSC
jgi:hypothetical protein